MRWNRFNNRAVFGASVSAMGFNPSSASVVTCTARAKSTRSAPGRYCEECKREGITGTKNSRGDFTFDELKARVREFFGRDQ